MDECPICRSRLRSCNLIDSYVLPRSFSPLKFSRFESTRLVIFPLSRTIGNSLFLLRNLNLLKFSIKSVRVQTLSPLTLSSRALICRLFSDLCFREQNKANDFPFMSISIPEWELFKRARFLFSHNKV